MLILNPISEKLIAFVIWIASGVYKVAAFVFQIFLVLCANELVDSDTYDTMINNFYAVLGVIVLFFLAFSFLKAMVNPDDDKLGTSAVKQIIINLVTSVIIMALVPTVFGFLYDMQHAVLVEQNTIGRFFNYGGLDSQAASENSSSLVQRGAYQIVNGVFTAFFNADQDWCRLNSSYDVKSCQGLITTNIDGLGETKLSKAMSDVDSGGKFGLYKEFADNVDDGEIDFQWLLSLAGGIALIYVGVSYCFDMALRMIKLVFYQLIAPIPIFARVVPDTKLSGSFEQWIKITLACYFEVYVRIFAMYFVIFLCTTMLKDGNFLSERIYEYGWFVGLFGKAFVLMGIVMFMRQAPKLISDVTGIDTGNMSLGIKNKLKEGGFFTAGAAVGGLATGGIRNFTNAVKNVRNKWGDAKGFKDKAKLIAGGVGSTVASTVAGAASGGFRGGRAGWGAGSFRDMSSAAGTGAREAVEARDRRAMYRARHDDTTRGVIRGRLEDAWDSTVRWAGINNIQELQEENAAIDLTAGKIDSVVDSARETIRSQFLAKGKTYGFGVSGEDSKYGIQFNADTYRRLSDLKDRATTSGEAQSLEGIVSTSTALNHAIENATKMAASMGKTFRLADYHFDEYGNPLDISDEEVIRKIEEEYAGSTKYNADEIQRIFGKYENDYAKEVANTAFKGEQGFKDYLYKSDGTRKVSYDEEAAFASIRSAAEDARHQLERSYGSRVVAKANEIAESSGVAAMTIEDVRTGDLKVTGDTAVDKFGTAAKIIKNENAAEISKIQQKEADKNGK